MKLINFFIENDAKLNEVVEVSLRPYRLCTSPPVTLSLCLDLDMLLDWYVSSLQQEMHGYVDNVMKVYYFSRLCC